MYTHVELTHLLCAMLCYSKIDKLRNVVHVGKTTTISSFGINENFIFVN